MTEISPIKLEEPLFDSIESSVMHPVPAQPPVGLDVHEAEILKYFLNDDELIVPSETDPMDLTSFGSTPFASPSLASADARMLPYGSPSSDSSLDCEDHEHDDIHDEDEPVPSSSTPSPPSSSPGSPQQPQAICPKALHAPSSPASPSVHIVPSSTAPSSIDQTMPHNPRKRARTASPEPRPTALSTTEPLANLTAEQLKKLSSKTLEVYAQNLAAVGALSPDAEKQIKRHRRLIKNRESAQLSRLRKKMYIDELERKVTHLTTQNDALVKRVSVLTQENKALRDEVAYLQGVIKQNPSLSAAAAAGRKPLSNNVKAAGVCLMIVLFSFGLIFNARKAGDGLSGATAGPSGPLGTPASVLSALGVGSGREDAPAVRRGGGRVLMALDESTNDVEESRRTIRKRKRGDAFGESDDAASADARIEPKPQPEPSESPSSAIAVAATHNAHKRSKVLLDPKPAVTQVAVDDVDMNDVDNDTLSAEDQGDTAVHVPHHTAAAVLASTRSTGSTFIVCPLSTLSGKPGSDDVILDGTDTTEQAEETTDKHNEFTPPLTDAAAELSTRLVSTTSGRNGNSVVALLVPSDMLSRELAPLGIDTQSVVELSCQVLNVNVFPALAANAL